MNWSLSKYPLIINPYDSFMKKHLQHYGYFTGRNVAITRFGYEPKRGFKMDDSDESDTESDVDSEPFDYRKKLAWKNKQNNVKLNDNYKWWLKDTNFFNLGVKESEYQREPRWPIEMQVLPERIKHIYTPLKDPEPYYIKTGSEEAPLSNTANDTRCKTVFYYNPPTCGYFIRSRVGGSREGCPKYTVDMPEIELENTLAFESRFESGNLMKAIKISNTDYELYIRYDLYTSRHTQWYYFQVKNAKPDVQYRFTIVNFLKSDSLYNMGMKPLMYSESDAKNKGIGWRRWGSNIKYYKNNLRTEDENGNVRNMYSLTWTCKFPNEKDTYYFAHCYPYTYTNLQDYIKEIQDDPVKSKLCKVKILCRSLAENLVHMLTITNPNNSEQENASKKGVVLTARVHPGETNSSWMMKGFLDYLLGNSADAKLLRDNFVFKIVPMLNPDGVIIGNYRCSLTGRDLNRNYKTVLKEAFPSIWHTREMVKKFMEERQVVLYCDLHGHSRKNNVFIYGCHNNDSPTRRFQEHVFPMMLSKNAKNHFSYKSCKFKIQKNKQGTGRIVMWNLGIMNSFTMEATFNGSTISKKANYHFNTVDLEQVAYHFCDTLLDYCDPDQTKVKLILGEVESLMKEQIRSKLESQGINVDQINLIEDYDKLNVKLDDDEQESSDDAGSDSSADDGLPLHLERFAKMRQRKKRKMKTRKAAAASQQFGKLKDQQQAPNNKPAAGNNSLTVAASKSTANINAAETSLHAASASASNLLNVSSSISTGGAARPANNNHSHVASLSNANILMPTNMEKEKKDKQNSANIASKQAETLMKETEKKLLKPLLTNTNSIQLQQIPPHPKSAKALNNGIPIFTHERAEERASKRTSQNAIQLQLDTETPQFQTDPNFLTFRYTIPPEFQYSTHFHPQSHLCEHHRKKLNDIILLRQLEKEADNKAESDGNASDDEADPNEETNEEFEKQRKHRSFKTASVRPTLEEYVKKNIFSRTDSVLSRKKNNRLSTSHTILNSSSRSRFIGSESSAQTQQPPTKEYPALEIRSFQRDEQRNSPKTEEESMTAPTRHEGSLNGAPSGNKYALDYMPKFVIKQMNERRSLNTTMISTSNASLNGGGSSVMGLRDAVESSSAKGITTTITPYNLYNAKNTNELVESTTKELNRRSSAKSNKIHSKLPTNTNGAASSSSSSSTSQKQHQKIIQSLQSTHVTPPATVVNHQHKSGLKSSHSMSNSNSNASVFSNSQPRDQGGDQHHQQTKIVHEDSAAPGGPAANHNYYGPSFAYSNMNLRPPNGTQGSSTQALVQPQFSLPRSNNSYPSQLSQSTSNAVRTRTIYK